MRLKDYPEKDGKRVWLRDDELESFIDDAKNTKQKIAFLLAGRCGLRRNEIVAVRPKDIVTGPTGTHLRVWEDAAKRDKYREPPVPERLANYVEAQSDHMDNDDALVDVTPKTIYRWVQRAAERRHAETGDVGWTFLDVHDLRRTWGTDLLEQGVLPSVVMDWGGWEDWNTFREHYLGEFSPKAIKRERGKVEYLEGGDPDAEITHPGVMSDERIKSSGPRANVR